MSRMVFSLLVLVLFQGSAPAVSPPATPIGLWQTVSDKTGEVTSLVRIYEESGRLFGRVERVLVTEGVPETCTKCKDERTGQKLVGLLIMRNMKKDGDYYRGGDVLDPENGKVYHGWIKLDSTGTRLTMRGYVDISLFGRSQTWRRVE